MKKLILLLLISIFLFGEHSKHPTHTYAITNNQPQSIKDLFTTQSISILKNKIPAPDFSLPLINGKVQKLSDLKGNFVFLNFWATWCPPCRAEMPSMEKLHKHFANKNLTFLAIDIREPATTVATFIKKFNLTFPIALDKNGDTANLYAISSIPMTFIIDKDGFIIATAIGARNWDSPEIISAFEALLKQ
jgi:thiol-disulfide isomerase/thioredoxin